MNYLKLFLFRTIGFRRVALKYTLPGRLTAGLALKYAGLVCLLWLGALAAWATDRYVSPYGTNDYANGYTNWVGAATNIQDVVSITTTGDKVWVSNGVYYFSTIITNTFSDYGGYADGVQTNVALLMITNGITVQSMNGPTITIIECYQYGTTASWPAHGVFLAYNSTLNGFTVRNGNTTSAGPKWFVNAGAGVRIHDGGAISNCIITTNTASHGGGVSISSSGGYVYNCVISNNVATAAGGGLYMNGASAGIVRDSIICDNNVGSGQSEGGGIYFAAAIALSNCVVTRNIGNSGAGIYSRNGGMVVDCQIVSNISTNNASAGGYCAYYDGANNIILNSIISYNTGYGVQLYSTIKPLMKSIVRNCLISGNSGHGIYADVLTNLAGNVVDGCTVVKNGGGGIYATGRTNPVSVLNSIIYSNSIVDVKFGGTAANTIYYNSCATNNLPATQGNITNNPQFVDLENANYRLRANSPCVNTGTNQSWMTNAVDLGGRARIRYGTVDMGAYEVIYNGTIFKF